MKYSPMVNMLFFLQYLGMIILWYWLFRDATWIKLAGGAFLIGHSAMMIIFPQLFPSRLYNWGRKPSEGYFALSRKYGSWINILFGILILAGYRIATLRTFGIVALLFSIAYILILLYWFKNIAAEERLNTGRYFAFRLSLLLMLAAASIIFISRGNRVITMFTRSSPYPMMVAFPLMGVWHFLVIRKKERSCV